MPGVYSIWLGKPVLLQVGTKEVRVQLRGTMVGESSAAVRIRIAAGWEVDIYKEMVLAIEIAGVPQESAEDTLKQAPDWE